MLTLGRAKYIEGLENRLGRMESLLRLSGLLSEDEGGNAPDLLTLERRLADRAAANKTQGVQGTTNARNPPNAAAAPTAAAAAASPQSTPQTEMHTGSNTSGNSPTAPQERGRSNDVEMISDMMCSLVTNSCGETRFIGTSVKGWMAKCEMLIVGPRVLLRVLDLLSEGHSVGEREDG